MASLLELAHPAREDMTRVCNPSPPSDDETVSVSSGLCGRRTFCSHSLALIQFAQRLLTSIQVIA